MILILNGSIGVGKSSVSWQVLELFDKSVMLDGDFIGAVHPFDIYDPQRTDYLYTTFAHLIAFHSSNGYLDFVVNYVFENNAELQALIEKLAPLNHTTRCYWLTCSEAEQRKRIQKRNTDQVDWELKRAVELNQIMENANQRGFIGKKVDTEGKTVEEVATYIYRDALSSTTGDSCSRSR